MVRYTGEARDAANAANEAAGNANTNAEKAREAKEDAESAAEAAMTAKGETEAATSQAREVIAQAAEVEGLGLLPTGLEVIYPSVITYGNDTELKIAASLKPSTVLQNIILLCDNNAVMVGHDGSIHINKVGKSVIHIVPTMRTALARSIVIEVISPTIRLVTKASMRLDASGNIRKN